jgi:transposase
MPTPQRPQGMCRDKGYDYPEVRAVDAEFGFTPHTRSRGEERRASRAWDGERARRWVVERLISWLNRFRRLLVRWEKRGENHLALNQFACGLIAWRSTGLFG